MLTVPVVQWLLAVLCIYTTCLPFTNAANILLLPYPYKSHVGDMTVIAAALQQRGHTLYVVLPPSYPDLAAVKAKYTVLEYVLAEPDAYTMPAAKESSAQDGMALATLNATLFDMTPVEDTRTNVRGFIELCTNPLRDADLAHRVGGLRINLAIVDGFVCYRCMFVLLHKLHIPYVSIITIVEPWLWKSPGALPSISPFMLSSRNYDGQMSFLQRVMNFYDILDFALWPNVPYTDEELIKRYLPDEPDVTFASLSAKSLLWLVSMDVVLDYPRPTMPNEINIGGLTTGPADSVLAPPELSKFASEAHDRLIVVSFGSSDVVAIGGPPFFAIFYDAFANHLQEYSIVWRYAGDIPAPFNTTTLPPHLRILRWIPQNTLLAHLHTRLFITHCGAASQFEALYHAVPMIGIPVFGDQPYNAQRVVYHGFGRRLDIRTLHAEQLAETVREVMRNSSYRDNIRRASAIFRSRPDTPAERAAWWIEHVSRHGGNHLHSHALDMTWYAYLMIDILALVILVPVMLMTSLVTCLCCWIYHRSKQRVVNEKIKQN